MKKRTIIIGLSITILLGVLFLFRFGGEILVVEDNIENVESATLILLMGSIGDRSIGAHELYQTGKVSQILMVESLLSGRDLLEQEGVSVPGDAELSKHILTELGVPGGVITILPGDAASTKDEALAIKNYLQEHPEIEDIILTTSKYHSYRSKVIFNQALKDLDVDIYSVPTRHDVFKSRGWYKDREDIQRVVTEYIKLLNHFLIEQFQMN